MLVVAVGSKRFALPAASIERIVQMVEFTPLRVTDGVVGALNVRGQTVPLVDPRPRFQEDTAAPRADQLLVLIGGAQPFAVWVDRVEEVMVAGDGDVQVLGGEEDSLPMLRVGLEFIPVIAIQDLSPSEPGPRGRIPG